MILRPSTVYASLLVIVVTAPHWLPYAGALVAHMAAIAIWSLVALVIGAHFAYGAWCSANPLPPEHEPE